jgi:hypothetical protein
LEFRGCCDHQLHGAGAAVLSLSGQQFLYAPGSAVGAVVHRHPAEERPHVLDASGSILSGTCAVEEFQDPIQPPAIPAVIVEAQSKKLG